MGTIKKLYQDQLVGGSGGTGQEVYPVTSTLGVYDTDNNQLQGVLDKFTTNLGLFTCGTSAATAAKTVSASKFALMEGGSVKIKFTYANSAASPTLAIGTTAAKPIIFNGSAAGTSNSWGAGEIVEFFYDGTNWVGSSTSVSVSQNTSTGHTDITIGSATTPVASVEEVNQLGQYADNLEWVKVVTDKDGRILYGVKVDGNFYFGADCPPQVKEYVLNLLNAKLDKDGLDADALKTIQTVENPEYIQVLTDKDGRILGGRKTDGTVFENCDVVYNGNLEIKGYIFTSAGDIYPEENPQWIKVTTDKNGKVLEGIQGDSTKVVNVDVELKGNLSFSEDSQIDNNIKQAIRKALLPETAKDRYVLPEYSNIVATFDNVIVRFIDNNGTQYLQFSKNAGYSWSDPIENTIGDIVHTHIFSNGTVLLCGYNGCYWTDDYTELHQSVVYDLDGSVFVGTDRKSFYSQMYHDRYFFVNGVEMEVFGEYLLEDETHPRNQLQARIWYSTDYGRTIKCAFKSGTSQIDGDTITIRHFHYVGYCDATNEFYISTGDNNTETYFLKGTYNPSLDSWSFDVIGQGSQYKFGYLWFDDKYIYILTDFTSGLNRDKKGILRVPIASVNIYSSYVNLYVCPDDWGDIAIVNIIFDKNGNKVLFPDYRGYGYIWVATNNYNFKKIFLNKIELIGFNTIGPNINGNVYVLTSASANSNAANQKQYNLTELLRNNGIYNFMCI